MSSSTEFLFGFTLTAITISVFLCWTALRRIAEALEKKP